jgi:hypothetical protein
MWRLKIGEPVFQRNLLLYPLYREKRKSNGFNNILTLDEGYKKGVVKFEEKDKASVSEVIFINEGDNPVFAIDGEEILGAYQNRVLNTSFWSEPKVRFEVPVTCVEERRWEGSRKFSGSEVALYPSLRAILAKSVNESLAKNRRFIADQNLVWRSIRKTLSVLNVSSRTLSIHDAFKDYESQIKWYCENLDLGDAEGVIAFAGSKFLCMDLFISPILFKKFLPKILRGYAIEAILLRERETDILKEKEVKEVINNIFSVSLKRFPAVYKGEEWRGGNSKFIVRGLKLDEDFVHLSAFSGVL